MQRILIQLDTDAEPSVFDAVVAVDSSVDRLLQYHGIHEKNVEAKVHGAIFTRGTADLKNTAIFIGGSDMAAAEAVLARVKKAFFGPMRVSVMFDPNGSNTTAVAAVLAAERHATLDKSTALVVGTGPVGQRAVRLLASGGAKTRIGSRTLERAKSIADAVKARVPAATLEPVAIASQDQAAAALVGVNILIAAGPPAVELIAADVRRNCATLAVAIDLNAVPPAGIGGIAPLDRAADHSGVPGYGAIGVGGTKMKLHKAAIARLFTSNDQVLDAEELYALGKSL